MIDTLKLRLNDFDVGKDCQLSVLSGPVNIDGEALSGEVKLFTVAGRSVFGAKAFLNDEAGRWRFTVKKEGAFLAAEVPRFFGVSNYQPPDEEQFGEFVQKLSRVMVDACIGVDLDRAALSRVDLFKNAVLSSSPQEFFPVLRSCRGKRMHRRDYGDTVLFMNSQREAIFYDKFKQLSEKHVDVSGVPRNTIRGELRLLNGRTVGRFAGLRTLGDLRDGFSQLPSVYKKQMSQVVFRYGTSQPEQTELFGSDLEILKSLRSQGVRHAVRQWRTFRGTERIFSEYGDIGRIGDVLAEAGFSRSGIFKSLRSIEADVKSFRAFQMEGKSFLSLYNELAARFLSEAA